MMNTVENFEIYAPKLIEKREFFSPGHRACQGCGEVLALRLLLKALGEDTVVSNATGCMEIISSAYPHTAWNLPYIHVAFENAAAVASGVEAGLKALRRKGKIADRYVKSVAIAGDGGTVDIGLQALSGAMERGHDMIFFCLDNEAYMNTGIQRSSATPFMAATTTSPAGKAIKGQRTGKKNVPEIMVAHNVPYVATACPSYPLDLMSKVEKARNTEGPSYIHIFSVCPTGWRAASNETVKLGRMAVETGFFPLYEVENGKYRLTIDYPEKRRPMADYLKLQGRFRHLDPADIAKVQALVDKEFRKLMHKVKTSVPWS
ncbi:MAG TPA: pyruvate synthase subunit PorB [Syntrophales bacterium]|jgi:pyruvate ferredoxin oxidoreductase beta subunit|nr:pyruvate synthase subunit PorB [Syntrophales bacterium]HOD98437.1 pyruvate synthase subunit PorB [Syntrophales bacterium]HOH73287.1 pyruvate synthase subunit PorB [Syntrophales bacterium]HPX81361.1 pyruvate synthase subunit PorB [Syntrophales bacterium]HQB14539.1 pyruvate synthase subunit PorB [Syntrophales bacterium]